MTWAKALAVLALVILLASWRAWIDLPLPVAGIIASALGLVAFLVHPR